MVNLIKQDRFGVIWFALLYLAVLLFKWLYLSPVTTENEDCYICVLAILMTLALIIPLLMTALWLLWSEKLGKGVFFLFIMSVSTLACAFLVDLLSQLIVSKLYYAGFLAWQESQLSYLFDDFLPHAAGLFLATLMIYTTVRIAISAEFTDRKMVISVSMILLAMSSTLLVMGLLLY